MGGRIPWLLTALALFSTGCADLSNLGQRIVVSDVTPAAGSYPRVSPDQMIVYASPKFAPKNYVILARVSSDINYFAPSEDKLFEMFKARAAQLGANAVVVIDDETTGGDAQVIKGYQPSNDFGYMNEPKTDLGYLGSPSGEEYVAVTPIPTPQHRKVFYKGEAYAVRVNP